MSASAMLVSPVSLSPTQHDPLARLADEFLARFRRGERPSIEEFAARAPELAEEIRELFPTLMTIESIRPGAGASELVTPVGPLFRESRSGIRQAVGDYRLIREIGRGGMGIVYEAEQASLGRRVALKVLLPEVVRDVRHVQRFQREARAAARLHHTNIVPVFGIGEELETPYYVMQYIEGQPLDRVLVELNQFHEHPDRTSADRSVEAVVARSLWSGSFESRPEPGSTDAALASAAGAADANGTVRESSLGSSLGFVASSAMASPRRANDENSCDKLADDRSSLLGQRRATFVRSVARIGVQVADALEYAAGQGVLHRDIKPSNLLLDIWGTVWVTDFGLAKATGADNLTRTGDLLGTLRYMAPERFRGQADIRSDVYSLGLTLREMLTQRAAFSEEDRGKLVQQILHEGPDELRAAEHSLPSDLAIILGKATALNPDDRYSSAAALAEDLRAFLQDRPISARRPGACERLSRWCRRNPALAGSIGLSFFLMAALAAIGWGSRQQILAERQLAVDNFSAARTALSELRTEQQRTMSAERAAQQRLGEARFAQAHASRLMGQPGQRGESLEALQEAAEVLEMLGPADQATRQGQLRNEAIAALPLVDLNATPTRSATGWTNALDARFELHAAGDAAGNISLLRLTTGEKVAYLPNVGAGAHAYLMKFSSDGRFFAAFHHREWHWRIWDIARAEVVFSVADSYAADFSADGTRIAISRHWHTEPSRPAPVEIYDAATGQLLQTVDSPGHRHLVAMDPAGQRLAIASQSPTSVKIVDLSTPETGQQLELAYDVEVAGLAWSSDGRLLATASRNSGAEVWSTADGLRIVQCQAELAEISHVAFHPQRPILATSGDDEVLRLWDLPGGRLLISASGGRATHFDPQGNRLAHHTDGATIGVWDVTLSDEFYSLNDRRAPVLGAARLSPNGRLLASPHEDGVRLWDVPARRLLHFLPLGPCGSVEFRSHDELLICGRSGLFRWPLRWSAERQLQVGEPLPAGVDATADEDRRVVLLPGGRRALVWVRFGRELVEVDLERRTERVLLETTALDNVHPSPDGRWIVTVPYDFSPLPIVVWDAATGEKLREIDSTEKGRAAFSPDARWLLVGTAREFQVWNTESWERVRTIERQDAVYTAGAMCFAPDSTIAALCVSRRTVLLFDVATGVELARLPFPAPETIDWPQFSADGQRLVVTTGSGSLHVCDLARVRQQLAQIGLDWRAR